MRIDYRKPLSLLITLAFLLTATIWVISATADARSINRIEEPWHTNYIHFDYVSVDGPLAVLTIREDPDFTNAFRDGDVFKLVLKSGVRWVGDENYYPGEVNLNGAIGGMEALRVSGSDLEVKIIGPVSNDLVDTITIPLWIELNGATGEIYVTIDPIESRIYSGTLNVAFARDLTQKTGAVAQKADFVGNTSKGGLVTIYEDYEHSLGHSFELPFEHNFSLRLPEGFVWDNLDASCITVTCRLLILDSAVVYSSDSQTAEVSLRLLSKPLTDNDSSQNNNNSQQPSSSGGGAISGSGASGGSDASSGGGSSSDPQPNNRTAIQISIPIKALPNAKDGDVTVSLTSTSGINSATLIIANYKRVAEVNTNTSSPHVGGGGGGGSSATNASLTPAKADYDQTDAKDITVTLNKGSYTLRSIKNGDYSLREGTDYIAEGDVYRITAAYLATIEPGEQVITFNMSGGTSPKLTLVPITIADQTPPLAKTPETLPEVPQVEAAWPFVDVSKTDWFYDSVALMYNNNWMKGATATQFSPNDTLTRAMLVTILWRMEGGPAAESTGTGFADVEQNTWYETAVAWAAENGIVSGYGGGLFGPGDSITRQDLAVIITRYMNYKGIVLLVTMQYIIYADESDIADYAMDAIQTLNKVGVINGIGENANGQTIIDPQGNATRAHTATMLMRFMEIAKQL